MQFRDARIEDLPLILESLTDAFIHDPFLTWFVRGGDGARDGLRRFFEFMVGGEPREAQWFQVSENCEAVALWVRWAHVDPAKPIYSEPQKLARAISFSGYMRLNNASAADKIVRSARADMSARASTKDIMYLRFLACRPDFQGRGIGTGLLARGLSKCDELGLPAYLETATDRNVAMYERRGFRLEKKYRFGQAEHIRTMLYRPTNR